MWGWDPQDVQTLDQFGGLAIGVGLPATGVDKQLAINLTSMTWHVWYQGAWRDMPGAATPSLVLSTITTQPLAQVSAASGTVHVSPGVPTNLSVTNLKPTSVTLWWDQVAGADGYRLEFGAVYTITPGSQTFWSFTGLTPETPSYQFRVRSDVAGNLSDWSGWFLFDTPEAAKTAALATGSPAQVTAVAVAVPEPDAAAIATGSPAQVTAVTAGAKVTAAVETAAPAQVTAATATAPFSGIHIADMATWGPVVDDTTTSVDAPLPSDIQEGDLLLLVLSVGQTTGSTTAISNPSGWTLVSSVHNNLFFPRQMIWSRVAGADEPATVTISGSVLSSGGPTRATTAVAVRGGAEVDVHAGELSLTAPSVTTTKPDAYVLRCWTAWRTAQTATFTGVPAGTEEVTRRGTGESGHMAVMLTKELAAESGATPTRTAPFSGTCDRFNGATVALTPVT